MELRSTSWSPLRDAEIKTSSKMIIMGSQGFFHGILMLNFPTRPSKEFQALLGKRKEEPLYKSTLPSTKKKKNRYSIIINQRFIIWKNKRGQGFNSALHLAGAECFCFSRSFHIWSGLWSIVVRRDMARASNWCSAHGLSMRFHFQICTGITEVSFTGAS